MRGYSARRKEGRGKLNRKVGKGRGGGGGGRMLGGRKEAKSSGAGRDVGRTFKGVMGHESSGLVGGGSVANVG